MTPEGKAQALSFFANPERWDAKLEIVRGHTGYAADYNLHQISLRMIFDGGEATSNKRAIRISKQKADRIFKLIEEANKII